VYKYADAIVKTFSTACASGVLLFLNVTLFHVHTNLISFLGASVIFIASYIYFASSIKPIPTPTPAADSENVTAQKEIEDNATIASPKQKSMFKWAVYVISIPIGILFFVYILMPVTAYYAPRFLVGNKSESTQNSYLQLQFPNISHIEELKSYQEIAIYGKRLCMNETKNYTRLFINEQQCVPIETCSDKVVLCRLQNRRNGSFLSTPINIRLMTEIYDKKSSKHHFFNASFSIKHKL
jgi:hypothetical protein